MPSKLLCIPLAKISDDLFLVVHLNFPRFSHQLSREFAPWMPPGVASCPGNDIFYFFFGHLPAFFKENWPLEYPPGWMSGAVAPSATHSARHCTMQNGYYNSSAA